MKSFNGSDFIFFYPPLVVFVDKQSPCRVTQNSQNSITQAQLKQIGRSRGRQNSLKLEVPQDCNFINNSYRKFRAYFDYSLPEVEQMLSDQQWIDFSLSAKAVQCLNCNYYATIT